MCVIGSFWSILLLLLLSSTPSPSHENKRDCNLGGFPTLSEKDDTNVPECSNYQSLQTILRHAFSLLYLKLRMIDLVGERE